MIPDSHRKEIIHSGINFMRSITKAYGNDAGLELYEKICSVLDPDVKGEILIALLCGDGNNYITIEGVKLNSFDKVARIRMIRNLSVDYMGLKDAKEFDDSIERGHKLKVHVGHGARQLALKSLNEVGYVCS